MLFTNEFIRLRRDVYAVYKLLNVSELVDVLVGVWMASKKGKWLIVREISPTTKMRISRERG